MWPLLFPGQDQPSCHLLCKGRALSWTELFLHLAGPLDGVLVVWKEQCTVYWFMASKLRKPERNETKRKKRTPTSHRRRGQALGGKGLVGTCGHDLRLQLTT